MAITRNGSTLGGLGTTTFAHDVGGSPDRALLVGVFFDAAATVSGVTYAGVAMTLLESELSGDSAYRVRVYGLATPTSGSNNVVISASGVTVLRAVAVSYAGVKASAFPVDVEKAPLIGVQTYPIAGDVNAVEGCWMTGFAIHRGEDANAAAGGTVTPLVLQEFQDDVWATLCDSDGGTLPVSGTRTMRIATAGLTDGCWIGVVLQPSPRSTGMLVVF